MGVLFTDSRTTLIARPQERSQAHDILEQAGGHVESLVVQDVDRKPFPVPRELAAVIAQVIEVMARGGTVAGRPAADLAMEHDVIATFVE